MLKLAIFDFDGTLYSLDTFTFAVKQLKKYPEHKQRYYKFIINFLPVYVMYKLKLKSKGIMVTRATKTLINAFEGLSSESLDNFYRQTFLAMADRINQQVVKEIQEAKKQGYKVIILSGAVTPLLELAGEKLGCHRVIGTEIPIFNGIVKPDEEIDHIYGKRKVSRLLEDYPKEKVHWEKSKAYADSFSDLDLLEQVGHPVAVQPDEKLAQVARKRGWPVIQ